ncbi:MAG TPA: HAMP domain-containing sensor histidine kinase [Blastocatellia bacterium]|jgi:signal transduction histidine kinase
MGKRKSFLSLVLIATLIIGLPVLAVVQYQLLGRLSEGERERMQNNLKASAAKFNQDFDREITRAFLSFQVDPSAPAEKMWDLYAERYERWLAVAPYPELVSRIYRADSTKDGPINLLAFNPSSRGFEPCEWPADFNELRQKMEQTHQHMRDMSARGDSAREATAREATALRGITIQTPPGSKNRNATFGASLMFKAISGPVEESIPALVIPAISVSSSKENATFDAELKNIIVRLNLDYIRNQLMPALSHRYFATGDHLDYKLAVVSTSDAKRIIYQSDDLSSDELSSVEPSGNLFALKLDEVERLAQEGLARSPQTKEPAPTRILADRFAVQVINPGSTTRSLRLLNGNEGCWQLMLKHRSGSLESIVASARRRNIAISFGILLLLGISIALIIISTRRAERLAHQQMEFVAGVSHELRTPLAVIRSAGENLADGVIEGREQVRRYGALIAGEGRRLTEMVEQVLEFSGIQSGRRTYQLHPTRIDEIIDEALAAVHPLIEEGCFEIEKEIEENLPLVAADRAALSRAIQNLLSNAVKYSGENRWIKICAASRRGEEVAITVEDRGIGIDPADLPHIFEPFHRGRAPLAAQIHGNGLGLSLVRHIVKAHGGEVTVESAAERGSSFTVRLPVISLESLESPESLESAAGNRNLQKI